jgi:hypothetical protein
MRYAVHYLLAEVLVYALQNLSTSPVLTMVSIFLAVVESSHPKNPNTEKSDYPNPGIIRLGLA